MRGNARPRCDVDLLLLGDGVVLQQRLDVLPAGQRTDTRERELADALQAVTGRVAKDGALHVRGLHLAAVDLDLAVLADESLRNEEGVVVVLREAEGYGNVVRLCAGLNGAHFRGVDSERVLDVLDVEVEVDETRPNPAWVAGNPALREGDELGAVGGSFSDELARLLDGSGEVDPSGLGLGAGDLDSADSHVDSGLEK